MVECLFSDNFSDGDMSDWQTAGNATAVVVEDSWMRLFAYGQYDYQYKEAYIDIGVFDGDLEFRFDWKVYSEDYNRNASRIFKVFVDGIPEFEKSVSDILYGSAAGKFDEVVYVSGRVRILFGLYGRTQPSPGRRANTLHVTNICVLKYIVQSVNLMSIPSGASIEVDGAPVVGVGRVSLQENKNTIVW